MNNNVQLTQADRNSMLALARETLVRQLHQEPPHEPREVPPVLAQTRACFVTLTVDGLLRGCIGNLLAFEPLYQAVIRNTRDAAQHDPRFSPVKIDELDRVNIEITVVGELECLAYDSPKELLNQLHPGNDGVLLHIGCRVATFLPQMWKSFPDKEDFLSHLSEKAGCQASAWRNEATGTWVFPAQSFAEE